MKNSHDLRVLMGFCLLMTASLAYAQPGESRSLEQSLVISGQNAPELTQAIERCTGSKLEKESIRFLIRYMPKTDLKNLSSDYLVANVKAAIQARNENPWAKQVPHDIFLNNVLPYASINERRDAWREDFHEKFKGLVKECKTTGEAAQQLNKNVFGILKVKYSTQRKKPDQSPFESMETGLASCTGLSVILVDACRSVGVPARLAGTPLWVNKRGNHTWVEVWDEGQWKFTGACEYDSSGLNRGWFKGIASQADSTQAIHRIYATSFKSTSDHFPMVWKRDSREVPGVDVTWKYTGEEKEKKKRGITVAIQAYDRTQSRVAVDIVVLKSGKVIAKGKTRDPSNDANDYFEVNLMPGKYSVRYRVEGQSFEKMINVKPSTQPVIKLYPKR